MHRVSPDKAAWHYVSGRTEVRRIGGPMPVSRYQSDGRTDNFRFLVIREFLLSIHKSHLTVTKPEFNEQLTDLSRI